MIRFEDKSQLRPWNKLKEEVQLDRIPFSVSDVTLLTGRDEKVVFARVDSRDWVNVLPINAAKKEAYLIRQYRVGSGGFDLETPGGNVDGEEHRDPTITAQRELVEETGLDSKRFLPLGSFNPNSAIMSNRVHFFLATDCIYSAGSEKPDDHEDIEVVVCPIAKLEEMVRVGQISHGLSALGILLALPYLKSMKLL